MQTASAVLERPTEHRTDACDDGMANVEPRPLEIRLHARDRSVFVDGRYLIRGVAGALLWKMLTEHAERRRDEFCYREMRLDPALGLPDGIDNLGSRLMLLQRRLAQRCPALRIDKPARGLARLVVLRPVRLARG